MISPTQILPPFSPENTELMLLVHQSVHGTALAEQIRWERYIHIPEGVGHQELPSERQLEVLNMVCGGFLDADANNRDHHSFTAMLGQAMCNMDNVCPEVTERTVRALLVHDLPEAKFNGIGEGDLTYDDIERQGMDGHTAGNKKLKEILMGVDFNMCEETATEIEFDMNDSKLKPPTTDTGLRIEMTESIGYVHSAVNAFVAIPHAGRWFDHDLHRQTQELKLLWLTENVFGNKIRRQVELASEFESVNFILKARAERIGQAFRAIAHAYEGIAALYSDGDLDQKQGSFLDASDVWFSWASS